MLFVLLLACLLVGMLFYGSIRYLLLIAENKQLTDTLMETDKRLSILSLQVLKKDQDRYWSDENQRIKERESIKTELFGESDLSVEGSWITSKSGISLDKLQSGAAVEISQIKFKRVGNNLKIRVKLKNRSVPDNTVGGYLVITLINKDLSPVKYVSATGGPLGELGFPVNFKSGRQYYLRNKAGTVYITQTYDLHKKGEYYTDVSLFVFSYKGSLLTRKSITLKKNLF
jgi:hypothetical protein